VVSQGRGRRGGGEGSGSAVIGVFGKAAQSDGGKILIVRAFFLILAVLGAWGVLRAQRPFREYAGIEYENFPVPGDWNQKTEWTRARLHVPGINRGSRSSLNWTMDYPRSDRHLLQGIRRLTRIDTRSVEQVVDLDGQDDIYNWPSLYAVEVGHWYLPDNDSIFHTIFDLDDRFQVPGAQYLSTGRTYEKDGYDPHWRAIYDDQGRVMVAICHDMDLGDAWEWSDDPRYAEKFAGLAYRVAVNYWIYDLTH